jgi:hypothetical protein
MTFDSASGSGWPGRDGDPEIDLCRKREIRRLWREACEGCNLNQWIPTPTGFTVAIPAIGTITLGDPTVMTVQLRSSQRIEHLKEAASDIAATMCLGGLRVKPIRGSWVLVELLATSQPGRPVAPSKPDDWAMLPPARRRGPSKAWTSRWHGRRSRRPEQPS